MAGAKKTFFGRYVLAGTFILAIFGWGVGFYGPPIYLQTVIQRTGWDVALVSSAVTLHFVMGAIAVANLPKLYNALGVPWTTIAGAVASAIGTYGWAVAATPAQLFIAAAVSGAGWVMLGAAAVNALISPWFVVRRPAALGMAYNGASVGGILFSPAWVFLIDRCGFALASIIVGASMVGSITALAYFVFSRTPEGVGQRPDGDALHESKAIQAVSVQHEPVPNVWVDRRFLTLCAGMALGLFAQIGLITHLFSIIAPMLGEHVAGWAMAFATCCAILGRTAVGRLMPLEADRRVVACLGYSLQVIGSLTLLAANENPIFLWLGLSLFGSGIGNATSLPPLIAQVEFNKQDVQRIVPLMVALSQGTYAFAPGIFGILRNMEPSAPLASNYLLFGTAATIQAGAIAFFYLGRRPRHQNSVNWG